MTITGIRLHEVTVSETDGKDKLTASYQLVTSQGKVLGAKELLSSEQAYGQTLFTPSPQTIKALRDAVALYRKDVELSLGLETN